MKQHFITQQERCKELILLFAGWSMDMHPFQPLTQCGVDCCICYDYTDMTFNPTPLSGYTQITVVAWSMGVWAAATTLMQHPTLPITHSIAVNGTHYPIDTERGIPAPLFDATLQGVSPKGMERFYRRICNNQRGIMEKFTQYPPQRSIESQRTELEQLRHHITTTSAPTYAWHQRVVGENDRIFSAENQLRAWDGLPCIVTQDAHFVEFAALYKKYKGSFNNKMER